MEYFAGLDVSMDETHVCVVDRDGRVVLETKTTTFPDAIAAGLARAPDCKRIVFETGRMAPMLYHGWMRFDKITALMSQRGRVQL